MHEHEHYNERCTKLFLQNHSLILTLVLDQRKLHHIHHSLDNLISLSNDRTNDTPQLFNCRINEVMINALEMRFDTFVHRIKRINSCSNR